MRLSFWSKPSLETKRICGSKSLRKQFLLLKFYQTRKFLDFVGVYFTNQGGFRDLLPNRWWFFGTFGAMTKASRREMARSSNKEHGRDCSTPKGTVERKMKRKLWLLGLVHSLNHRP